MLPASERARNVVFQMASVVVTGLEQVFLQGEYAEVRMVDGAEFDAVIKEPGRLVIVDFHHEETSGSYSEKSEFDESVNRLPSKVLIAKVLAGRNIELMDRLQIHNVPTLRVYREGQLLEEFKGKVDTDRFLEVVRYHLANPDSKPRKEGYIGPLQDDWLPEGVQQRPRDGAVTPLDYDLERSRKK